MTEPSTDRRDADEPNDMAHDTTHRDERSVATRLRRRVRSAWGDVKSVYWANTLAWRALKSGALVFLGFFCWAGSSVLLTYLPELTLLQYTRAYGFLVLFWGPLTHLIVVPLAIRLRRSATGQPLRWLARNGSKLNLSLFVVLVLVLGTWPVGAMTLDFQGALASDGPGDVDPSVDCSVAEGVVTCHVEDLEAIDRVVVRSSGRQIASDGEAPYEPSFAVDEPSEVVGQRQFTIELCDENGKTLRRFVRTVPDVRSS